MKRAPLVWAAVVIPIWVVLVLCTHWEPVIRDGWGHYNWHRLFPTTPSNVWMFFHDSYLHNNPRLGQVLTMLVFTPGPWHSIITPIVELTLFVLLTTLALGRWPSPRRTDDALVFASILAMVAATAPQLGPMLFYRPFTGNYLFGLVISLAFIVPYRIHAETPRPRGIWWIAIMLVAGFATGLSNEHTGPAFAALAVVAVVAFVRRGERPALWMIAGLLGIIAGGLTLYYAPGQEIRYNGLANQSSLLARVTERGLYSNAKIVMATVGYSWRMVPWLVLGGFVWWTCPADKPRRVLAMIGAAAAVAIAMTLLASPKQGPRLYFAPICLLAASLASVVIPRLATRVMRGIAWAFAGVSLAYFAWACIKIYSVAGPEFAARIAAIEHAAPGATITLPPYSQGKSRWFLGDDFVVPGLRNVVAQNFGLAAIQFDRPVTDESADPR